MTANGFFHRHRPSIGVSIFLVSLIVQASIVILFSKSYPLQTYEYEDIARHLLKDKTFSCEMLGTTYYSLTPPLYPIVNAVIYFFTNYDRTAMLFVQMIFLALTCTIIYGIAKDIFDKNVGKVASVLCMLHPGMLFYSTRKLHELTMVSLLFSLLMLTILKLAKDLTYKKSVVIGALIGVCILTRASVVLFLVPLLLWLWWDRGALRLTRELLTKSIIIVFTAALVISPWVLRNYYVHREFVFIQTPTINIWVGNNSHASGSNFAPDGRRVLDMMPKDFVEKVYRADELGQARIFKKEVYDFIREQPLRFVTLFFKKVYYFWWFSPSAGLQYPRFFLSVYKGLYVAYFLLFIVGLYSVMTRVAQVNLKKVSLLVVFLLSITVMQSLFYVEGRHRWAVEPLILIFSAAGIAKLCKLTGPVHRGTDSRI